MLELLLVSQSPRRRELLQKAGFSFRTDTVKISENIEENLNLGQAVAALARTKAQAYKNEHKHLKSQKILLLTADTVVVLGDKILGKPSNGEEAAKMLNSLSGKTHSVITGLCLWNLQTGECLELFDETKVHMKRLSEKDIEAYIETGEPMDKAGAYGIQGLGGQFVEKYEGSYSNVVGLPMELFESTLKKRNWNIDCGKSEKN